MQNTVAREAKGTRKHLVQDQMFESGARSGFCAKSIYFISRLCHQKISEAREPQAVPGSRPRDSEPIYPGVNLPGMKLFRILAWIERSLQFKK